MRRVSRIVFPSVRFSDGIKSETCLFQAKDSWVGLEDNTERWCFSLPCVSRLFPLPPDVYMGCSPDDVTP